jgi:hypothetical protein
LNFQNSRKGRRRRTERGMERKMEKLRIVRNKLLRIKNDSEVIRFIMEKCY